MNEFFEADDKKYFKNVLLIDYYNLVYRSLFIARSLLKKERKKENLTTDGFGLWKFFVLDQLREQIHKHKPDRVVIAIDSRKSWRKGVYAQYKANRKARRANSGIDFDSFFPLMEAFTENLKEIMPNIVYLNVDGAEADDIIGVLVKEKLRNVSYITCLSTDKDMHQLLKFNNYYQYDPIKKQNVNVYSPTKNLLVKIIIGDTGDNIPGIKTRVGISTAKKIIDEGLEVYFEKNQKEPSIRENFKRNKILIDFDMIPGEISVNVKKAYDEYVTKEINGRKLYSWLIKQNQPKLVEEAQSFIDDLKKIS